MVTFDPDKKRTKRGLWRTLFGLNPAADVRRARLSTRDVKTARGEAQGGTRRAG